MFGVNSPSVVSDDGVEPETASRDGASTGTENTYQTSLSDRGRQQKQQLQRRKIRIIRPSCSTDGVDPPRLGRNERTRIQKYLHRMFRDSKLPNRVNDFPRYDSGTLAKGTLLGTGAFCSVYKFRGGTTVSSNHPHHRDGTSETKSKKRSPGSSMKALGCVKRGLASTTKSWLFQWTSSSRNRRTFNQEYAIKTVNEDIVDIGSKELFVRSIAYLAAETRILSGLSHPHIIRLCGIDSGCSSHSSSTKTPRAQGASGGSEEESSIVFHYGHFIVLERLQITLKERIKKWDLEHGLMAGCLEAGKRYPRDIKPKNYAATAGSSKKYNQKKQIDHTNRLYEDRIEIAIQLSSAIVYLHEQNILHRDIKPHNIGFGSDGSLKLFDFGIAKEITKAQGISEDKVGDERYDQLNERLYNLTGLAGSRPYMSPENGLCQPYNAKTDVYSFSMVLWQLMTLRKLTHGRYSNAKLETQVWVGPRPERPPLVSSPTKDDHQKPLADMQNDTSLLERPIENLLERCWAPVVGDRPTMKFVQKTLESHLAACFLLFPKAIANAS